MVVTQRTQALHNAVLGSCDTMIAHRLTAPADQDPVKKWLKGNVDKAVFERVSSSLASLKTGTGWMCSGEAQVADLVRFPKISTFDNSATPTDGDAELKVMTAPVDRDRLRAIIGDAVKLAENEEPEQLRARIARLESQLGAAAGAGPDAIAAARREGFERARREASEDLAARILHLRMEFQAALHQLEGRFIGALSEIRIDVVDSFALKPAAPAKPISAPAPWPAAPPPAAANGSGAITSAGQKMLTVLDTNPPIRRTWKQVATLAGLKARGGHFNTGKKSLVDSGLIVEDGDHVYIASPSSAAVTGSVPPAELVEMWCHSLSGAAPNILRTIFANGGVMTQAKVAEVLGVQPRGGHWNTGWKELRDNDVLTVRGGTAELTELFRP